MLLLLTFFLIIVFGYQITNLTVKDSCLLEKLGLSFPLGIGFVTLFIFFYSWEGIKISSTSILAILLILNVGLWLVSRLFKSGNKIESIDPIGFFRQLKIYEKIFFLLIVLIVCLNFLITSYYPVYFWDALALYDFTAKIIAHSGYFAQIAHQFFYFAQYPLLVPLGHTIVYLFGGRNPQFIYSLYFLAFATVIFSAIRRKSGRAIALFGTLLLVTNPILFGYPTIAYTNLPYTIFYVLGIIYLYNAMVGNRLDYLFMSSLLIGLSTWARSLDPLWVTGVLIVVIYSFYKKSLYPLLIFIPTFLLIRLPWSYFQIQLYGGVYSESSQFSLVGKTLLQGIDFRRMIEVTVYIIRNVISSWGPISLLFLIAIFLDIKSRSDKKNVIMLLIILANFLILFVGTYLFSIRSAEWKIIPDSAVRLSMFIPPLMIYYISLVSGKFLSKNIDEKNII